MGHDALCFIVFCFSRQCSEIARGLCNQLNESTHPHSRKYKYYDLFPEESASARPVSKYNRQKMRLNFAYYETCFLYYIDKKSLVC